MALQGKGMFTWKIPRCENGNPSTIASLAKSANFSHVLVKIADGTVIYNGDWGISTDLVTPLVKSLRTQGLQVWGWHYVYGDNPLKEAQVAIQRIKQFKVDGYVIDAEEQYKEPGKKEAAKQFMKELRTAFPNLNIALSSYRYPSYHTTFPWQEFLEKCDLNMPQVYWMDAHNPGDQLRRCVREFRAMTPFRPVFPTGAAFNEEGWKPTASEVLEFLQTAKSLNLTGTNFWEWSEAHSDQVPGVWDVIRDFPWESSTIPQDMCEKYITALNKHDPNQMVNLYSSTAVHVTAARTIQGIEPIRQWYNTLFNQVLPNAVFNLTGFVGTGASRHFTWTAASNHAIVMNGNDTLGLLNEKIAYHYSFFSVTPV